MYECIFFSITNVIALFGSIIDNGNKSEINFHDLSWMFPTANLPYEKKALHVDLMSKSFFFGKLYLSNDKVLFMFLFVFWTSMKIVVIWVNNFLFQVFVQTSIIIREISCRVEWWKTICICMAWMQQVVEIWMTIELWVVLTRKGSHIDHSGCEKWT